MTTYNQARENQRKELEAFKGLFFAFSNKQLEDGLKKVGATTKEIYSLGAGTYIVKTKMDSFNAMLLKHEDIQKELLKDKKELFDALVYELCNHEYCITYCYESALEALGLDRKDVPNDILSKACDIAARDGE